MQRADYEFNQNDKKYGMTSKPTASEDVLHVAAVTTSKPMASKAYCGGADFNDDFSDDLGN